MMGALLPALVALALVLCLLPFVGKGFTIDDPLFLWLAQHIQASPGDPFGFYVNWSEGPLPMHAVTMNPPGMGYLLAAAGGIVGWSERALHAVVMIPAAVASLSTFGLARRLGGDPLSATAIAVLTPVFLVSATTVMADTTLLAFWCGGLWCFLAGLDSRRSAWLWLSGVLILCAALTKYFGIALVPLLAVYLWLREPRWMLAWGVLLLPLAGLLGHELWLDGMYGHSVLLAGFSHATAGGDPSQLTGGARLLVGLAFAGGCLPVALALAPWLWTRRVHVVVAGLLALAVADAVLGFGLGPFSLLGLGKWPVAVALQFLVMWVAGVAVAGLALSELREREPDAVLLALWLLGTLVFAIFLNWTQSARTFLPAAPALGILLARRLAAREVGWRAGPGFAVAACAVLAFSVAAADARWASQVRDVAARVGERFVGPQHRTFGIGHWGLQWYLEAEGVHTIDYRRDRFEPGDLLVEPGSGYAIRSPDAAAFALLEVFEHPEGGILHTMSPEIGVGFHAGGGSPLPWAFGRPAPDFYRVWRARRAFVYPREP